MKIYLDAQFLCHAAPAQGLREVETAAFDGKCPTYIEGYRYIPEGERWQAEDGTVYTGEMIAPWKPWEALDAAQREYEWECAAALEAQNAELVEAMAEMVEDVYNADLAVIEEG